MKGIVFNLLEEVVSLRHGDDAWDDVLDGSGLAGSYTSLGSYPDAELGRLLHTASTVLHSSAAELLRWFGREAMPLLAARYPAFFDVHTAARPFILSVNSIIHPEVRKLYAGAHCPHFNFADAPDGALLMEYSSQRLLCHLAHGFIEGAAAHYGETAEVVHLRCMHRGDANCLLHIAFS